MLTSFLIFAACLIAFGLWTDRRADLREARIEATFPPQGQFVTVNGRNIHVLVKGTGPDLVLIHGAGGNLRDLDAAMGDELAKRYRVFLVDRPGHGWSERLGPQFDGAFNTRAESPAEQAAALSEAVAQLGARDPIVMGHSYGGAVAMAWALDHPASALVIASGVTLPWPGEVDFSYRILGSRFGGAFLAPLVAAYLPEGYVKSVFDGGFASGAAPDGLAQRTGLDLAIRTGTLRANNRQVRTLRPFVVEQAKRYPGLILPIELLHGATDTSVYLTVHSQPLSQMLGSANLTVLDGVGHMTQHLATGDIIAAIDRAALRAGLR